MNGRIYDPTLGRFLQADPHIQAPKNSQSYNRYSYVLNNPMNYTDPSGYFFKKLYKGFLKATGIYAVQKFLIKNPMLSAIAQIVVGYYGGPWAAAGFSYDQSFVATGSLNAAFKSGAISYAAAWGAGQVGANYGAGTWENIAGHAIIGGVASDLQGGNFGHGFWAAGVTAYAKGANGDFGLGTSADMKGARVITAAVVGGTASVISGGKFANGAVTGAFTQLFNAEKSLDSLSPTERVLLDLKSGGASYKQLAEMKAYVESFTDNPKGFQEITGRSRGADLIARAEAFAVQNKLSVDLQTHGLAEGVGKAEFLLKTTKAAATRDIPELIGELNSQVTSSNQSHFLQPKTMGYMYIKAYYSNYGDK